MSSRLFKVRRLDTLAERQKAPSVMKCGVDTLTTIACSEILTELVRLLAAWGAVGLAPLRAPRVSFFGSLTKCFRSPSWRHSPTPLRPSRAFLYLTLCSEPSTKLLPGTQSASIPPSPPNPAKPIIRHNKTPLLLLLFLFIFFSFLRQFAANLLC